MSTATKSPVAGRASIFARIALFIRQVVAELKKVVWPTRPQLVHYVIIVVIFLAIFASIVAVMDYVFTKMMLLIFG